MQNVTTVVVGLNINEPVLPAGMYRRRNTTVERRAQTTTENGSFAIAIVSSG